MYWPDKSLDDRTRPVTYRLLQRNFCFSLLDNYEGQHSCFRKRKMNIKLDKLVVEKFSVVAISLLRSRYLGRHATYFHNVINFLSIARVTIFSIWPAKNRSCPSKNTFDRTTWPDNVTGGSQLILDFCSPAYTTENWKRRSFHANTFKSHQSPRVHTTIFLQSTPKRGNGIPPNAN